MKEKNKKPKKFTIMKKLITIFICKILYHVKYIGMEKIDDKKKYIICPTHSSIYDPTFIFPKVTGLAMMAKSELFKNPILNKGFRHYGAFPVDRSIKDIQSLLYSIESLDKYDNSKLLIFPEGGILKDELVGKKVKNGAIYIASETKIPVIPVYITRHPKKFHRVYVIFGDSYTIPEDIRENKEKVIEYSKELLKKMYELREP